MEVDTVRTTVMIDKVETDTVELACDENEKGAKGRK